ncbi:META domain-containing protein [Thalassotalea crassostreae]|uniref:META domain-containing protein n=1 Tax=Thalassotalea crassostreae TaxID=1763536 RepID=UPI0012FD30DB|nr:META domain-containing protein [Thalassotalea crassostreae]
MNFKNIIAIITAMTITMGCQNNNAAENEENLTLEGHYWVLKTIAGKSAIKGENNKPVSIEFLAENNIYRGFGGCNNYSGSFEKEQNTISFGPARATRKFCQTTMDQESALFEILSKASSYKLSKDTLTVGSDVNQVLAVFVMQGPTPSSK